MSHSSARRSQCLLAAAARDRSPGLAKEKNTVIITGKTVSTPYESNVRSAVGKLNQPWRVSQAACPSSAAAFVSRHSTAPEETEAPECHERNSYMTSCEKLFYAACYGLFAKNPFLM
eukprot:2353918-Amphidinium_carterae.2